MAGQKKLLEAHVLLVGLGGLGSAVGLYLASSGIGRLSIADGDVVDLSNLQRQVLYTNEDIGRLKTESAGETLRALNPNITLKSLGRLHGDALAAAIEKADVVVDASDNFATRYAINACCVAQKKTLVSGAVIRFEGQVGVFMSQAQAPCYECLYARGSDAEEACAETGVLAPLAGMIGCVQAIQVIQVLAGMPVALAGKLFLYDALRAECRHLNLVKRSDCPACGS